MKLPKILRPEVEVEYVGVKGFFAALYAICRVGIKRAHINVTFGGKIAKHYYYVIPKYKFKRVSELSEDEEK